MSSHGDENDENLEYTPEEPGTDRIQKLTKKLQACERERQENLEGWQRARADFVNARNEEKKRIEKARQKGREDIVIELMPILDSFEMALFHATTTRAEDKKQSTSLEEGLTQTYNQLISMLSNAGIAQINPHGEHFDPTRHEAVESVNVQEKEKDNIVLEVRQKGYAIDGTILRPARVRVGVYKT